MNTQVLQKKLKAVRDFGAVALFTGASIFYYHATMPEQPATPHNPEVKHAFVDGNPIRLHWITAAFKQDDTPKQAPSQNRPFLDGKPIRLGQ